MIHIATDSATSKLDNLDEKCICPNAVDLRLQKVLKIQNRTFTLSEEERIHRGSEEIPLYNDWWTLAPGSYEVIIGDTITIGPDEAGWVIPRSSLNRNGIFLTSGLYDSGYTGPMAACLHVNCGQFQVKKGTRIGQFLLFKAQAVAQYEGSYGYNKDGSLKTEQSKFTY